MVEKEYIVFRESLLQSVTSDLVSAALLLGGVWFNQHYIGGSYLVNAMILLILMLKGLSYYNSRVKKFTSLEDLKKHVAGMKP